MLANGPSGPHAGIDVMIAYVTSAYDNRQEKQVFQGLTQAVILAYTFL